MKLVLTSALLCIAGLCGCATPPAPGAPPVDQTAWRIDTTQMSLVDQAARHRGVQVVWVNAPRKLVVVPSDGS